MAREIVHRIQGMRRSANFDIADHINTYYDGDDYVKGVMTDSEQAKYIAQETLSRSLAQGVPGDCDFKESFKLSGHQVELGVKKVS